MKKLLILFLLFISINVSRVQAQHDEPLRNKDVRIVLRYSKRTLRSCKDEHFKHQADYYRYLMKNNPKGLKKLNMIINVVCAERKMC